MIRCFADGFQPWLGPDLDDLREIRVPKTNPLLAATDAPPIPAAQAWKAAYDGRLGPMIDLAQAVPGSPPPQALLDRLAATAGTAEATT